MKLLVGCPLKGREWMLDQWIDAVLVAVDNANISRDEIMFGFAVNENDSVLDALLDQELYFQYTPVDDYVGPNSHREHHWSDMERIEYMVYIRNELLELVRLQEPEFFLSLDSDILLHPEGIKTLLAQADQFDAVGGKTYLHRQNPLPSYARIIPSNKQSRREDYKFVMEVDVIMAIKLMSPKAYGIDYKYDRQGEDYGWSENAKAAGLKLGYDGTIASKHVMEREMLDTIDKRVGY